VFLTNCLWATAPNNDSSSLQPPLSQVGNLVGGLLGVRSRQTLPYEARASTPPVFVTARSGLSITAWLAPGKHPRTAILASRELLGQLYPASGGSSLRPFDATARGLFQPPCVGGNRDRFSTGSGGSNRSGRRMLQITGGSSRCCCQVVPTGYNARAIAGSCGLPVALVTEYPADCRSTSLNTAGPTSPIAAQESRLVQRSQSL